MKKMFVLLFFFIAVFTAKPVDAQDNLANSVSWQVLKYDITANLPANSSDRVLSARAIVTIKNVGRGTGSTATFRINQKSEVLSAKINGTDASFRKTIEDKLGNLQRFTVSLPSSIQTNQNVSITIDYRLPVPENTGLSALSTIGSQFLPLSAWYPTPNNALSPRGADYAPFTLKVTAPGTETIISSGSSKNNSYEQSLNGQPFFLTGNWDVVEASSTSSTNSKAFVPKGSSSENKQRALELLKLTAAVNAYLVSLTGFDPNINEYRLVAVRRGAGYSDAGTILLDYSAFTRPKIDSQTIMTIAEGVAKSFFGNAIPIRAEGHGVIYEGLTQFLATQFVEKQFGKDAAEIERLRQRSAHALIAKLDAPLSQTSPADETYFASVANKGAMIWRLLVRELGEDKFYGVLRSQIELARNSGGMTLTQLRGAFSEAGGGATKNLLNYEIDQSTDTDLLVGLPQLRGTETIVALRNQGSLPVTINVAATTDKNEVLNVTTTVPDKNFGEAIFKTNSKIIRVELDSEKFYPQFDYSNDFAPRITNENDVQTEITREFNRQEFTKAESISRKMLQIKPHYDEVRVWLGRSLLEQKRFEEAEKEFTIALNEALPTPRTLGWANAGLGRIALLRNQPAAAAKFFEAAIKTNAEYGTNLAARSGRIESENKANLNSSMDESAKTFFATFDRAVQSTRKSEVENLILAGELIKFSGGIVGGQPELWQTKVVRTEIIDSNLQAVEVNLTAKMLGQEQQTGTALFTLARTTEGWKLASVDLFEVK